MSWLPVRRENYSLSCNRDFGDTALVSDHILNRAMKCRHPIPGSLLSLYT